MRNATIGTGLLTWEYILALLEIAEWVYDGIHSQFDEELR